MQFSFSTTWGLFRICVITDVWLWLVPRPDSLGLSCHTKVCLVLLLVLDFLRLESKNRFFLSLEWHHCGGIVHCVY